MPQAHVMHAHRQLWEYELPLSLVFPADRLTIEVIFEFEDRGLALLRYLTTIFRPQLRAMRLSRRGDKSFTLTPVDHDVLEDDLWQLASVIMGLGGVEKAWVQSGACHVRLTKQPFAPAIDIHDFWRQLTDSEEVQALATIEDPNHKAQ
jgi:hypothetical protein